jgi:2-phospho-L-lactate guanylyltransferase
LPDAEGHIPGIKLAAVIPMKPLAESKSRLAPVLDATQRASLSLNLLDLVLKAAVTSSLDRVIVLGGDGPVRCLAFNRGAQWMSDSGGGLNSALSAALEEMSAAGLASMYIPGDLPHITPSDIETVIDTSRHGELLTLCPAAEDTGTNGLVVPPASTFRPMLGPDSFTRHLRAVQDLPHAVCDTPGFGFDLDSAADLEACERIQPGFMKRMLVWCL